MNMGGHLVRPINEDEAEILIEEHLRERGWSIADFDVTRKRWREHLDGEEADRVFLQDGRVVAILEAKKPGKDLWAALDQAKGYARAYRRNTGHDVPLLFASDGKIYLRQNLKANTLPEKITAFPTPAEFWEFFRPQAMELHGTLRDYQRVAVSQVLGGVQAGRRRMYLQMATGTGKTFIAFQVAWKLESQFRNLDIRLIDHNREKCERLASELKRTLVLCGDGADETLLRQEGIEEADGLVCATESDEANLLFAVIGKALGARKTIAVARRKIYMKLDNYMSVDAIVNPNSALASVILRHARYKSGGGALSIIEKIDAEMLELVIPTKSPAVGRTIMSLGMPKGMLIALIVRKGDVFVPVGATVIQGEDKVIVFATSDLMPEAMDYLGVQ